MQLPLQLASFPPASQVTVHGALPPQTTLQVDPASQVTSQPPPWQFSVQLDATSQSKAHPPPLHPKLHVLCTSQSRLHLPGLQSALHVAALHLMSVQPAPHS